MSSKNKKAVTTSEQKKARRKNSVDALIDAHNTASAAANKADVTDALAAAADTDAAATLDDAATTLATTVAMQSTVDQVMHDAAAAAAAAAAAHDAAAAAAATLESKLLHQRLIDRIASIKQIGALFFEKKLRDDTLFLKKLEMMRTIVNSIVCAHNHPVVNDDGDIVAYAFTQRELLDTIAAHNPLMRSIVVGIKDPTTYVIVDVMRAMSRPAYSKEKYGFIPFLLREKVVTEKNGGVYFALCKPLSMHASAMNPDASAVRDANGNVETEMRVVCDAFTESPVDHAQVKIACDYVVNTILEAQKK